MAIDDVGHPPKPIVGQISPLCEPVKTQRREARPLRQVSYPVVAARCIGRASSQTGDDGLDCASRRPRHYRSAALSATSPKAPPEQAEHPPKDGSRRRPACLVSVVVCSRVVV